MKGEGVGWRPGAMSGGQSRSHKVELEEVRAQRGCDRERRVERSLARCGICRGPEEFEVFSRPVGEEDVLIPTFGKRTRYAMFFEESRTRSVLGEKESRGVFDRGHRETRERTGARGREPAQSKGERRSTECESFWENRSTILLLSSPIGKPMSEAVKRSDPAARKSRTL